MTTPLDAALNYAARGWAVIPLMPRAKVPATTRGEHAATTDPDIISRWWTANPDLNVGIATGPSGLAVVDLDHNEAASINGVVGFITLCADLGHEYPQTLEADTPNGCHLLFERPVDVAIKSNAGRLGEGIDVRGQTGYIVAPPSWGHTRNPPVREVRYEWINDNPVAALPEWITARLSSRFPNRAGGPQSGRSGGRFHLAHRTGSGDPNAYAQAALRAEVDRVRTAPEGTRNDTLNAAAYNLGQLVAGGVLGIHVVELELTRAALAAGLTEREIGSTVRSGLTKGADSPRSGAA